MATPRNSAAAAAAAAAKECPRARLPTGEVRAREQLPQISITEHLPPPLAFVRAAAGSTSNPSREMAAARPSGGA